MDIKITTLSENSSSGFLAEWGLSMLVEADGKKILFDTGMGTAVIRNVQTMKVNLADIDKIIISHGHHDHTGGLRDVLAVTGKKEIIAHPDIWSLKYGNRENGPEHFAGIPFRRELLENLGGNFYLSKEPVRISEHMMTTGEIPMTNDFEVVEKTAKVKEDSELKPDPILDDLGLIIDTEYGLVVILGCAHRGIINTLRHVVKLTGKDLIYAAIGGTHLVNSSQERLKKTAAALLEMGVQYLGVSHCTGFNAAAYLAQVFGDRFFQNNSGTVLKLPFKD